MSDGLFYAIAAKLFLSTMGYHTHKKKPSSQSGCFFQYHSIIFIFYFFLEKCVFIASFFSECVILRNLENWRTTGYLFCNGQLLSTYSIPLNENLKTKKRKSLSLKL